MKKNTINILITGAAGNLGSLLARHLVNNRAINLKLMTHKKDISEELKKYQNVSVVRADLKDKNTLKEAVKNTDVVIHFAGVLFKGNPEKFLSTTNTEYFKNLVDTAAEQKVKRIILISFPHVEGESSPEKPAKGMAEGNPESIHAKTRLEEEKYLLEMAKKYNFDPVILRLGMVYGKGILMIETARKLAKYWFFGVWKKPTWIHLISTADFLTAAESALLKPQISGIYQLGDEGVQTIQEFLDALCTHWGYKKPWRMPLRMIGLAAKFFEFISNIFHVRAILTRDFVKIGTASYYMDTSRARRELLPNLKYRTYKEGIETL